MNVKIKKKKIQPYFMHFFFNFSYKVSLFFVKIESLKSMNDKLLKDLQERKCSQFDF